MQAFATLLEELGDAAVRVDRLEQLDLATADGQQRGADALILHRRLLGDAQPEQSCQKARPSSSRRTTSRRGARASASRIRAVGLLELGILGGEELRQVDHDAALLPGGVVLHLAVEHEHAAPVGHRLETRFANSTSSTGGLKTRFAMSIWLGCSDHAPTQPRRNAARNWSSQPIGSEMSPNGP
jgi:hypothetical protein